MPYCVRLRRTIRSIFASASQSERPIPKRICVKSSSVPPRRCRIDMHCRPVIGSYSITAVGGVFPGCRPRAFLRGSRVSNCELSAPPLAVTGRRSGTGPDDATPPISRCRSVTPILIAKPAPALRLRCRFPQRPTWRLGGQGAPLVPPFHEWLFPFRRSLIAAVRQHRWNSKYHCPACRPLAMSGGSIRVRETR